MSEMSKFSDVTGDCVCTPVGVCVQGCTCTHEHMRVKVSRQPSGVIYLSLKLAGSLTALELAKQAELCAQDPRDVLASPSPCWECASTVPCCFVP